MRIKSFFSKTVDEAIAQARAELGAEALLLNTRKLTGEAGKPGGYEVVFGLDEEEAPPASAPRRSTPNAEPGFSSDLRDPPHACAVPYRHAEYVESATDAFAADPRPRLKLA